MEQLISIEPQLHPSQVWFIATPNNQFFQVLATSWSLIKDDLGIWANEAINIYPNIDIVWRLFITYHYRIKSNTDLTKAITYLMQSDNIFDSTYNTLFIRPPLGVVNAEALVLGAKWLQQQAIIPDIDAD